MPPSDSLHAPALDPAEIHRARRLLASPTVKERVWPALAAAAFAACAALSLAAAMIVAPPTTLSHPLEEEP